MGSIGAFISAAALLGGQAVLGVALAPTSAANPASQACADSPAAWTDPDGDTCQVYAEKGWCHAGWISKWNSTGFTAREACCQCGGGVQLAAGIPRPAAKAVKSSSAADVRSDAPDLAAAMERSIKVAAGVSVPAPAPMRRSSTADVGPHAPLPTAALPHDFAGVHPARLPTDIASAVAEGSIDMATVVASGVWPPKPKLENQPAVNHVAQPMAHPLAHPTQEKTIKTSTSSVEAGGAGQSSSPSQAGELAIRSSSPQAVASEGGAASAQEVTEFAAPKQQPSPELTWTEVEQRIPQETPVFEPPLDRPRADATNDPTPIPLDAAGRRNPLLAWKVEELQKEAYSLQAQLSRERADREDVLRRDGVQIGELEAQTKSESAEIQEWKHRASALELRLNSSQLQQKQDQQASSASFHRLEKLFHQLERKAEEVQGSEKWNHQEVQQLQARAREEQKQAASAKDDESQLKLRLRESKTNLSKALKVVTAEKKKSAALNAWKDKATRAIEAQGQRIKAEKALGQKMKLLIAKEKQNDHDRDEKMYALELRLQKAEGEKRSLLKKVREQGNRISQLEAGDDVSFDDDEKVMVQASSTDDSSSRTTTTTQEPEKASTPLLSSWARLIRPQLEMSNTAPLQQDTSSQARSTPSDSVVAGVPQDIRQSSALWNLWKQSSI